MKRTQLWLSEVLEMNRSLINKYCKGTRRPSWENAKRIADKFDLSPVLVMDDVSGVLNGILNENSSGRGGGL